MKPENKFKAKLVKELRRCGWLVIIAEMLYSPGFPDLIILKSGRVVLVEVKQGNNELLPDQRIFHADWRKHGGEVFVVRDDANIDDIIDKISS